MSTQNLCFEQKYKNIRVFLSENFQILEVKFSIYLKRRFFRDVKERLLLKESICSL